jgi:two-component system, OmpR family, sensor histidine kinase BaeS
MKSAYSWLLRSFLSAFMLLIITQLVILSIGTGAVLKAYSSNQVSYLEELALKILLNPAAIPAQTPEHAGPFFVFSADRNLVYSNRGKGRSIPAENYTPVIYRGSLIGYFYAGEVRFLDTESNRLFFSSLILLTAGSMLLSIAIAAAAAVRAAGKIAGPVNLLQQDIRVLRRLRKVPKREFSVSELSEISSSLHEVSELLAGEDEYKSQWMQNMAHDLRTPISGLKSQLEGMRDGVLEASPERLNRNLSEIERLEELASGISELYALETIQTITTEEIPADEFCAELRRPFEHLLAQKEINLGSTVETDTLRGNRPLLLRALRNIIANGISYSPAGSRIEISMSADKEGGRRIRIANNGPRIPEDQLEKIFQRFYRGEFGRSSPGSGLGLNIARQAVQLHGGSIFARNLEPEGVEFEILLPGALYDSSGKG